MGYHRLIFSVLLCLLSGCRKKELGPDSCLVKPTQRITQIYNRAEGILRQYPSSDLFYIEVTECGSCQRLRADPPGLTAPPSPCNLPLSFRKDGIAIVFSGQLRVDTTLNYSVIDISGIPLQLSFIDRK